MAALNINTLFRCETCAKADRYGNGCKEGLMYPVLLFMSGAKECNNYKFDMEKIL